MALLRGRLLAGALFAGALFGAQDIQENVNDLITPLYGAHDEALLNKIRDKYEVIDLARKIDANKNHFEVIEKPITETWLKNDKITHEKTVNKKSFSNKKQVSGVKTNLKADDQAKIQAKIEQNLRNEIALLLILSEV